ncbi:transposase [Streptomyces sp. NPDC058251]|uniref:transposase n=1 Tax=Streptomyces sp. NPDC058251 TaxID=3346404 RepID=UPI0036E3C8E1
MSEVARPEFELNPEALRGWVNRHEKQQEPASDAELTVNERARLKELERRNRELEMEVTFLKNRKVKNAAALAEVAVEAAKAQHIALPGESLAAAMVLRMAKGVRALDQEIAELDAFVEARFNEHQPATVIRSLPSMGTLLGAEFIAATGGDLEAFGTADRLASFAGLSLVPRDAGRVSGNMRRPRRYHRDLPRAGCVNLTALSHIRW